MGVKGPDRVRDLLSQLRSGNRFALARAISLVENMQPGFETLLHELHGEVGSAARIGITGPPGAGKSTLISQLVAAYRRRDERVGVVAVDPTSPYTGGALLGDRIRMNEFATDPGVFIRSMATRGTLGGLTATSNEVADVLDASGFNRVIVETVGVGQSELEIAQSADTTVVVLVPESGDAVQAMKAGLMEVADIFVVNKADRVGADKLVQELNVMLRMRRGEGGLGGAGHHGVQPKRPEATSDAGRASGAASSLQSEGWSIPVLKTVAAQGEGIDQLIDTLDLHAGYLRSSGQLEARRKWRFAERTRAAVDRELRRLAWTTGPGKQILEDAMPTLAAGTESPYSVAARILAALPRGESEVE